MSDVLPDQQAYLLAAGIAAVLITASFAGWVLKVRTAIGRPHAALDNLNARIGSWWIIAGTLGLALWAGRLPAILLFVLVAAIALREFHANDAGSPIRRALGKGSLFVALPLQFLFVWLDRPALVAFFVPIYALVGLPIAGWILHGQLRASLGREVRDAALGVMICVYAVSHAPALLALAVPGHEGRSVFLLLYLVVLAQSSDVLQYLWGKLAGSRAIAPGISPGKTVEGTLGGIVSAIALGVALAPITPFAPAEAAAIALAVTSLGFLGGLMLSAIKRARGIKDWSDLIPGHGGILDRVDSLVLSAPFFYYVVYFGWT